MNFSSKIKFVATSLVAASLAAAMLPPGAAFAQSASSLDGEYKGTLVCAQLPGQPAVARAPMDFVVADNSVKWARPIFNGAQVVASEVGAGTIEGQNIHLTSSGHAGGARYEASYNGSITPDGGTLTGTQAWTALEKTQTRPCTAAFVKVRS